jgi:hypothetical protein
MLAISELSLNYNIENIKMLVFVFLANFFALKKDLRRSEHINFLSKGRFEHTSISQLDDSRWLQKLTNTKSFFLKNTFLEKYHKLGNR